MHVVVIPQLPSLRLHGQEKADDGCAEGCDDVDPDCCAEVCLHEDLRHVRRQYRTGPRHARARAQAHRPEDRRVHLRRVDVERLEDAGGGAADEEEGGGDERAVARAPQQHAQPARHQHELQRHRAAAAQSLDHGNGDHDARELGQRRPQEVAVVEPVEGRALRRAGLEAIVKKRSYRKIDSQILFSRE